MATDTRRVMKLILVGDSAVGKTSLVNVYVDDFFLEVSSTIGYDIKFKDVVVNLEEVKLSMWDTGGQERFKALAPLFYRGTQGALLVYDVTYRESFDEVGAWMDMLDNYCTTPDVVKVLVANKTDLKKKRKVTEREGRRLAQVYNIAYFECSAREKRGVEVAFEHIVNEIYRKDIEQVDEDSIDLARQNDLEEEPQQKRSCRC